MRYTGPNNDKAAPMPIRTVFLTLFAIASPLLGLSMLTQAADAPSPRIVGGSPAADRWP